MISNISNIENLMTPSILSKADKRKEDLSSMEKEHWRQAISWFFLTDMIKTKIRSEIQRKMKKNDFGTLILSIILIITQFVQQFLYLTYNKIIDKQKRIVTINIIGKSSALIESLRAISSLGSFFLLGLITFHYALKKNLLIFKQKYEINSSFKSTGLLLPLVFELLLSLIHTPPLLNNIHFSIPTFESNPSYIPIDINIPITVLSLSRFYLIIKFYFNYSKWGDDLAVRICRESNVAHGMLFVLKAELKNHPFILIPILFIASVIIFGYSLAAFEMCLINNIPLRYYNDWTNYFNGIWCISTSMISLGYGDFNPKTLVGRILILLSPIWGLTILSYFFLSLITKSQMTSKELLAYREISNIKYKKLIRKQGLKIILSYYRFNRIMQFSLDDNIDLMKELSEKRRKGVLMISQAIKEFKVAKRILERSVNQMTMEDLLRLINRQIKETLNILVYSSKSEMNALIQRIEVSKEFQEKINKNVKSLLYMNTTILTKIECKDNQNQQKTEDEK